MAEQPTKSRPHRTSAEQRRRKLRKIRAAVRVGAYENDLKLHVAIDRLLRFLDKAPVKPRSRSRNGPHLR
jgi:hypothetical protein